MGSYLTPQNLQLGGTATGMLGSIMGGVAASRSDRFNAKIAEQNAALDTQNAALEGGIGEADFGLAGMKTRQEVGNIKAAQAGRGIDVNTGSAKDVQRSQAEIGMLNALNIRSNAARAAYGYETEAVGFKNQAALDKARAGFDMSAGLTNAGTIAAKATLDPSSSLYIGGSGPTGGDTSGSDIELNPSALQADNSGFLSSEPTLDEYSRQMLNNGLFNAGSTG